MFPVPRVVCCLWPAVCTLMWRARCTLPYPSTCKGPHVWMGPARRDVLRRHERAIGIEHEKGPRVVGMSQSEVI
ncbi:hypothetical protein EDB83DRAFT_2498657 [Lactarius deliciosus]|nr:hypothetical protein EDB83DRAFT_2498657 [Lactarius deliciosus]